MIFMFFVFPDPRAALWKVRQLPFGFCVICGGTGTKKPAPVRVRAGVAIGVVSGLSMLKFLHCVSNVLCIFAAGKSLVWCGLAHCISPVKSGIFPTGGRRALATFYILWRWTWPFFPTTITYSILPTALRGDFSLNNLIWLSIYCLFTFFEPCTITAVLAPCLAAFSS